MNEFKLVRGQEYQINYVDFDEQQYYRRQATFLGVVPNLWGRHVIVFRDETWYYSGPAIIISDLVNKEEKFIIEFKVNDRGISFSDIRITDKEAERLFNG